MPKHLFCLIISYLYVICCAKDGRTKCNVTNRNVTNHDFLAILESDESNCDKLYTKTLAIEHAMVEILHFVSDVFYLRKLFVQRRAFFNHVLFL